MKSETSVVREHEEFMWLHGALDENENYAGFIVSSFQNFLIYVYERSCEIEMTKFCGVKVSPLKYFVFQCVLD